MTHLFIAGLGTGGTFRGTGSRLQLEIPGVRLVAVQPDSPLHGIEGLKHMESSIVPGIFDPLLADENMSVRTEDAKAMIARIALEDDLRIGVSDHVRRCRAGRALAGGNRALQLTHHPARSQHGGPEKAKGRQGSVNRRRGLGAPLSLYLAAAGVGKLGIVDNDTVDLTNLQRQILYRTDQVGEPKARAAAERLRSLNPEILVEIYETRLSSENALNIIRDYDLAVDGTDNFPTRYLVNDACVLLGKPQVYGSIFRTGHRQAADRPTRSLRCPDHGLEETRNR